MTKNRVINRYLSISTQKLGIFLFLLNLLITTQASAGWLYCRNSIIGEDNFAPRANDVVDAEWKNVINPYNAYTWLETNEFGILTYYDAVDANAMKKIPGVVVLGSSGPRTSVRFKNKSAAQNVCHVLTSICTSGASPFTKIYSMSSNKSNEQKIRIKYLGLANKQGLRFLETMTCND